MKLRILARRVLKVARRFFAVPDLHYDALADGIATPSPPTRRWVRSEDTAIHRQDSQSRNCPCSRGEGAWKKWGDSYPNPT
ncbi:MAG: hypothetical protein ACE5JX_09275 [Acidobacteriota bacterium]